MVSRQLAEGRICGVCQGGTIELFTGMGVYHANAADATRNDLPVHVTTPSDATTDTIWIFFDADPIQKEPSQLVSSGLVFPVHVTVTTPDNTRYYRWQKQRPAVRMIMDPWSDQELRDGLVLQSFYTMANVARKAEYLTALPGCIEKFGRSPRDIYAAVQGADFEGEITELLENLRAPEQLSQLRSMLKVAATAPNAFSHQSTMIQRNLDPHHLLAGDKPLVDVKTPFIGSLLFDWARRVKEYRSADLFHLFRSFAFPKTNSLGGWMFGAATLRR
ncbi:hypothetical protein BV25DRAFT_333112 [Artomyces pyxidatus]|uniref:Uncharacterized protein n=1 Tax=Artomyces pyxidatus TaxID=48021 RepID=A0ACB8T5P5_9AGAM|nr:hypothetical protein BV25DRAFT_333112 [Artomyces pyxidatus]